VSSIEDASADAESVGEVVVVDRRSPRRKSPGQRRAARDDAVYRRALALSDFYAGVAAIILLRLIQGGQPVLDWDLLTAVLIVVLAKLMTLYDSDRVTIRRSTLDEVPSLVILAAVWSVIWSLLTIPLDIHPVQRGGAGLLWLLLCALLISLRSTVRAVATRLSAPERILIVGGAQDRESMAHSLSTDPGAHITVVGLLPLEDERHRGLGLPEAVAVDRRERSFSVDDLAQLVRLRSVDRVLFVPSAADSELMVEAVRRVSELDVDVSLLPRLFEVVGSAVEFDTVGGVTVLGLRRPGLSRSSKLIKRTMDLVGSSLGVAIFSPLFLITALAIKLDTPGPVFFRQQRVGRDGRPFDILKFRSMVGDAEAQRQALECLNETHGLFKLSDDPRVTRIGRMLRRCSIDELPQLFNVLRGEMSLVGPRPLVLAEDALVLGRHRERLTFAPGMTGPWQVLGPVRPPLSEMVKTDYLYAITWTLWLDVKILLRTISHIRSGHGR
jgi:exopolysaccharide biosynthesis polyprenyl glycosylphosphotransferase